MKKIAAILLVFVMCLCVTACGNSAERQSTGNTQSTENVQNTDADQSAADSSEKESDEVSETNGPVVEDETSGGESTPADINQDSKTEAKTLVVYFSATGTTKGVAETIASVTGADIYEIVPVQIYTSDDLNYNDNNSRTTKEQNDKSVRPEINGTIDNWDSYAVVYLGYPIWWGEEPRILDTFVESYSFDGKTVIPFCTSGGSGVGSSDDNLKANAGSGNWLEGTRHKSGVSESDIQNWINGLNIES